MEKDKELNDMILEVKEDLKTKYVKYFKSFDDVTIKALNNREYFENIVNHDIYLIYENILLFRRILNEKIDIITSIHGIIDYKDYIKYYKNETDYVLFEITYLFSNLIGVFFKHAKFEGLNLEEFYTLLFIKLYKLKPELKKGETTEEISNCIYKVKSEMKNGETKYPYSDYLILVNKHGCYPIESIYKRYEDRERQQKSKWRWF